MLKRHYILRKCCLLPPKLQRRGLVFKGKMVTMKCVQLYNGLLWCVCYRLIWVILACANFIRVSHVFWQLLVTIENDDVSTKIDYNFHHWAWYMGHTSMCQFHTGLGRFLVVAGYKRKWWCINKSIIIFIIELGIWVIRACPNFVRGCPIFWRWLVTIENDNVSTNLL